MVPLGAGAWWGDTMKVGQTHQALHRILPQLKLSGDLGPLNPRATSSRSSSSWVGLFPG